MKNKKRYMLVFNTNRNVLFFDNINKAVAHCTNTFNSKCKVIDEGRDSCNVVDSNDNIVGEIIDVDMLEKM